jgi:uncharacterized protein YfaS (alpha-2-macroglobulin family)
LAAADYLARATGQHQHVDSVASEWSRLTFEDQARLAQLLSLRRDTEGRARGLLRYLWQQLSVAGNRVDFPDSTMVTVGFPSHIRPAARLLRATQAIQPRHPNIGPLVQRIIQRERAERGWWWNTQDYAFAAAALASFTAEASSRTPFALRGANGQVLMQGDAGPEARELEVDLSTLTLADGDSMALPVSVKASAGPVYVTLTVNEVRRERPVAPDTKGLIVERWYERVNDGTTVTEIEEGELVRVRLRVTAPGDREFVAVDDPLPAGLEAVDTRLRTTSVNAFLGADAMRSDAEQEAMARGTDQRGWTPWGERWWSWSPWDNVETYDDRVVFVARTLGAGSHVYSYLARATTPGRFVRPQAHAEEMYNPALAGRSDGGWFVIRARR